jgi:hypothetical protein
MILKHPCVCCWKTIIFSKKTVQYLTNGVFGARFKATALSYIEPDFMRNLFLWCTSGAGYGWWLFWDRGLTPGSVVSPGVQLPVFVRISFLFCHLPVLPDFWTHCTNSRNAYMQVTETCKNVKWPCVCWIPEIHS